MFDFSKIENFDDHIKLSIPSYEVLFDTFRSICLELSGGGVVLDVGCSSGSLLNSLSGLTSSRLIGCDPVDMPSVKNFEFIKCGVADLIEFESVDVVVCMFTLQFLSKKERVIALQRIRGVVSTGGVALIAEKVYLSDSKVNTMMHKHHMQSKRSNFCDSDILNKDRDLSGSMHCVDNDQLISELSEIGRFEQVWQCYNFKAFIVR